MAKQPTTYFIIHELSGKQKGPFTAKQVHRLILRCKIVPGTKIAVSNREGVFKAKDLFEMAFAAAEEKISEVEVAEKVEKKAEAGERKRAVKLEKGVGTARDKSSGFKSVLASALLPDAARGVPSKPAVKSISKPAQDSVKMQDWFLLRKGKIVGPMTWESLDDSIQSGEMLQDDRVRRGSHGEWVRHDRMMKPFSIKHFAKFNNPIGQVLTVITWRLVSVLMLLAMIGFVSYPSYKGSERYREKRSALISQIVRNENELERAKFDSLRDISARYLQKAEKELKELKRDYGTILEYRTAGLGVLVIAINLLFLRIGLELASAVFDIWKS